MTCCATAGIDVRMASHSESVIGWKYVTGTPFIGLIKPALIRLTASASYRNFTICGMQTRLRASYTTVLSLLRMILATAVTNGGGTGCPRVEAGKMRVAEADSPWKESRPQAWDAEAPGPGFGIPSHANSLRGKSSSHISWKFAEASRSTQSMCCSLLSAVSRTISSLKCRPGKPPSGGVGVTLTSSAASSPSDGEKL